MSDFPQTRVKTDLSTLRQTVVPLNTRFVSRRKMRSLQHYGMEMTNIIFLPACTIAYNIEHRK